MMTRYVSARLALCDMVSNDIDVEPDCSRVRAYVHDRVLFSPTEVIFDTAASRSEFENSELLRDVAKSDTPTMIWGVHKGVVGIRIDDEGTFRDLGTVGIDAGAAGNILLACRMVDTGRPYRYDGAKDEYIVVGTDNDYVFTRRHREDGGKSCFYTRDFT